MSWQDYEYGPADDDYMTPEQASENGWLDPDEAQELRDRIAELERVLTMPDRVRRQWRISDLITNKGYFNRSDLVQEFKISTAQAAIDMKKWLAAHPSVAVYSSSSKRYERARLFKREE